VKLLDKHTLVLREAIGIEPMDKGFAGRASGLHLFVPNRMVSKTTPFILADATRNVHVAALVSAIVVKHLTE